MTRSPRAGAEHAEFVLSREATGDLREVDDHIAVDDPASARRVLEVPRAAMVRLADHPGFGHLREDLADEALRVWTVHSYLAICRPDERPLQLIRVLSGYRDIAALIEWTSGFRRAPAVQERSRRVRVDGLGVPRCDAWGPTADRRLVTISQRPASADERTSETVDHRSQSVTIRTWAARPRASMSNN